MTYEATTPETENYYNDFPNKFYNLKFHNQLDVCGNKHSRR